MAPSRCAGFISRRFVPVGRAAVPFDPVRVVEAMLGVVDAGTPKEFDQAVVVVDEADHLSVYGDHPTTGRCGVVHDYRGAHPSRVHQAPDRSILSSGLPSPVWPTGILFRLAKTIQVLLPPGLRHCKRLTVPGGDPAPFGEGGGPACRSGRCFVTLWDGRRQVPHLGSIRDAEQLLSVTEFRHRRTERSARTWIILTGCEPGWADRCGMLSVEPAQQRARRAVIAVKPARPGHLIEETLWAWSSSVTTATGPAP